MGLKALKKAVANYDIVSSLNSTENFSRYADDPIAFIETELGEFLTDDQKAIALSVVNNRETNVQASHAVGKSFVSSRIVLWWICTQGAGAFAITTSPTKRQVNQILWGEIRPTYDRHKKKIGGERGETYIRLPENIRALGFTSRANSSDDFQGLHDRKLLIVIDEASGVSDEIDAGAKSCVTGALNRLVRIGNPTKRNTAFHRACQRTSIRIPAWSHPNVCWAYDELINGQHVLKPEVKKWILNENGEVKDEEMWEEKYQSKVPGAVSVRWIEEARRDGEGSAFWQSRVEGLFPVDSEQSIVPRSWFQQARSRYDERPAYWDQYSERWYWRHGLDVADGGDDHAIASWRGPVLFSAKSIKTLGDREDISRAAALGRQALEIRQGALNVDRGGVGSGALSELLRMNLPAYGTHWGSAAKEPERFKNNKAEDFWNLREAFRNEEVAIAPLGDFEEILMEELAGIYWEETSTGKIQIEDKKKTRQRLHKSPDVADAVVLGFSGDTGSSEILRVNPNTRDFGNFQF